MIALLLSPASLAFAQAVPSAGQQAAKEAQSPSEPESEESGSRFWELPALSVPGEAKPELREEERVGAYAQPRWTAARRFPTTRIYVIPEGKAEFEYWVRYTFPWKDPTSRREVRNYYEIGYGLGHRGVEASRARLRQRVWWTLRRARAVRSFLPGCRATEAWCTRALRRR